MGYLRYMSYVSYMSYASQMKSLQSPVITWIALDLTCLFLKFLNNFYYWYLRTKNANSKSKNTETKCLTVDMMD